MFNQSHVDAAFSHHNDLLVEAARLRLAAAATRPSPAPTPRTVSRFCAGLRHAVASLVALATIG